MFLSRLRLLDFPSSSCSSLIKGDSKSSDLLNSYNPNVMVVVFAVDDRRSLERAGSALALLRREGRLVNKVGVLVANKTDFVRSRVVTEEEGKTLAGRYEVSYMETSTAIKYNVDELLVMIVKKVQEVLNKEQNIKTRKTSVTDRIKDLVARKNSRENS